MITTCWIGPFGLGLGLGFGDGDGDGDGVGLGVGGLRFFAVGFRFAAVLGVRFDRGFLIPRPV